MIIFCCSIYFVLGESKVSAISQLPWRRKCALTSDQFGMIVYGRWFKNEKKRKEKIKTQIRRFIRTVLKTLCFIKIDLKIAIKLGVDKDDFFA